MRTHARSALVATTVTVLLTAVSGCGALGEAEPEATPASSAGESNWTTPVTFTQHDGSSSEGTYEPIDPAAVSKEWSVCALFPHMKNPYWLAGNYGILEEAKRDGLRLQVFEAGGYENLSTQVSQMEDCITQKYDAIVLGAISGTGLCNQIKKALAADIPVVDFLNGTVCPDSAEHPLLSHTVVSFYDLAITTGEYLKDHAEGDTTVGFFPGPEGAVWSDGAVKGFNESIEGSDVEIAVNRRGDAAKDVQLRLIEDSLRAYPEIDTLVGVDIAADAGTVAVRNAGLEDEISVYAFDITPPVYDAILSGDAVGSPTDYTVMQGRMAVDQAVRMLEEQPLTAPTAGPLPEMITVDNAESIEYSLMFAPRDFKATYTWSPEK